MASGSKRTGGSDWKVRTPQNLHARESLGRQRLTTKPNVDQASPFSQVKRARYRSTYNCAALAAHSPHAYAAAPSGTTKITPRINAKAAEQNGMRLFAAGGRKTCFRTCKQTPANKKTLGHGEAKPGDELAVAGVAPN